jgi:hypothetical protein
MMGKGGLLLLIAIITLIDGGMAAAAARRGAARGARARPLFGQPAAHVDGAAMLAEHQTTHEPLALQP